MFEMLKKLWKNMRDYKQELSLGAIFTVSLATFNVVFPPAVVPTVLTLGTLAVGTTLYYVGRFVTSFFSKNKSEAKTEQSSIAPVAQHDETTIDTASTAQVVSTLQKNKTARAPEITTPSSPAQSPVRDLFPRSPATLGSTDELEISRTMSLSGGA